MSWLKTIGDWGARAYSLGTKTLGGLSHFAGKGIKFINSKPVKSILNGAYGLYNPNAKNQMNDYIKQGSEFLGRVKGKSDRGLHMINALGNGVFQNKNILDIANNVMYNPKHKNKKKEQTMERQKPKQSSGILPDEEKYDNIRPMIGGRDIPRDVRDIAD